MVSRWLPLLLEIVGTDRCQVTLWALPVERGVVCGLQRMRAIGRLGYFVFREVSCFGGELVFGGIRCCYMSRVAHGATMVELWPRASRTIGYTSFH